MRTLQGIDASLAAACSCTEAFKVSAINASSTDIVQLMEPMNGAAGVQLAVAADFKPGAASCTLSGFVYWCVTYLPRLQWRHTPQCRWQMDFQEGNVSYCTRDGCSFKLAAYRVPPVTVCEGQPLHVHVQLADSTVVFRATV